MKINMREYYRYLFDIRGNPKIKRVKDITAHIQEYSCTVNKAIDCIKTTSAITKEELPQFGYIDQKMTILVPASLNEYQTLNKAILGALVYIVCSKRSIENEYLSYSSEEQFLSNNTAFVHIYASILDAYYHRVA